MGQGHVTAGHLATQAVQKCCPSKQATGGEEVGESPTSPPVQSLVRASSTGVAVPLASSHVPTFIRWEGTSPAFPMFITMKRTGIVWVTWRMKLSLLPILGIYLAAFVLNCGWPVVIILCFVDRI